MLNFLSNATAALTLSSIAIEAGDCAKRQAKNAGDKALARKDIRRITGNNVLNKASEKHNAMKEMVSGLDIGSTTCRAWGNISGFVRGFGIGMKGNYLAAGCSILTLLCKCKPIKVIGAAASGVLLAFDFIKNGTNLFTDKDEIIK